MNITLYTYEVKKLFQGRARKNKNHFKCSYITGIHVKC